MAKLKLLGAAANAGTNAAGGAAFGGAAGYGYNKFQKKKSKVMKAVKNNIEKENQLNES